VGCAGKWVWMCVCDVGGSRYNKTENNVVMVYLQTHVGDPVRNVWMRVWVQVSDSVQVCGRVSAHVPRNHPDTL
jgi:hypothetical protein